MSSSPPLWRRIQRENFVRWQSLADYLELSLQSRLQIITSHFPLNLPRRLAAKMQKKSLEDPLLRQFLPLTLENEEAEGFVADPLEEKAARKAPKLLHKYRGRALLLTTGACAMHCRYCFRREFDYASSQEGFAEEIALIRGDPSIKEIILSGGDPLSLSHLQLESLLSTLCAIPHIQRIRFHTRFPIGIPERIDPPFLDLLAGCRAQIYFVIHSNHPREWDEAIFQALKNIQKLGIPVLHQAVLLRGVNDDFETLKELYELLIDQGILPYYLFQLDAVKGAAHFFVPQSEGEALMHALRASLPGFGVPRYAQEFAGESSKRVLL